MCSERLPRLGLCRYLAALHGHGLQARSCTDLVVLSAGELGSQGVTVGVLNELHCISGLVECEVDMEFP